MTGRSRQWREDIVHRDEHPAAPAGHIAGANRLFLLRPLTEKFFSEVQKLGEACDTKR